MDYDKEENELNKQRKAECEVIKELVIKDKYPANCYTNYQLFGKDMYSEKQASKGIKVAGFNIWNLGYNQTRFKDLKVLSGLMNKWDVIGTVEIIPIGGSKPGGDEYNNVNVEKLIKKVEKLEAKKDLSNEERDEIEELKDRRSKVEKLYRMPGYIELLNLLRKRDASWSLIISPRELGAAGLKEMTGYYFRSKKVKLNKNPYCEKMKKEGEGVGYACVPEFTTNGIMDKDYRPVFSKRPFMASFKSGDFDFSMLALHTKFRKPKTAPGRQILQLAYGVNDYKKVEGLNGYNYYRFAETQTTLQFINEMKKNYGEEKDYIFVGDFNLNGDESYWAEAIKKDEGTKLYIDTEKTSVSESLVDSQSDEPTNGLANNYDHFLFNPSLVKECNGDQAQVEDFYSKGYAPWEVSRKYKVREDDMDTIQVFNNEGKLVSMQGFPFVDTKLYKVERHAKAFRKELEDKKMVNTRLEIVEDPIYLRSSTFKEFKESLSADELASMTDREIRIEYYVRELRRRLYDSQQLPKKYYAVYKETLSDHLPIHMQCKTNQGDDD